MTETLAQVIERIVEETCCHYQRHKGLWPESLRARLTAELPAHVAAHVAAAVAAEQARCCDAVHDALHDAIYSIDERDRVRAIVLDALDPKEARDDDARRLLAAVTAGEQHLATNDAWRNSPIEEGHAGKLRRAGLADEAERAFRAALAALRETT